MYVLLDSSAVLASSMWSGLGVRWQVALWLPYLRHLDDTVTRTRLC